MWWISSWTPRSWSHWTVPKKRTFNKQTSNGSDGKIRKRKRKAGQTCQHFDKFCFRAYQPFPNNVFTWISRPGGPVKDLAQIRCDSCAVQDSQLFDCRNPSQTWWQIRSAPLLLIWNWPDHGPVHCYMWPSLIQKGFNSPSTSAKLISTRWNISFRTRSLTTRWPSWPVRVLRNFRFQSRIMVPTVA